MWCLVYTVMCKKFLCGGASFKKSGTSFWDKLLNWKEAVREDGRHNVWFDYSWKTAYRSDSFNDVDLLFGFVLPLSSLWKSAKKHIS